MPFGGSVLLSFALLALTMCTMGFFVVRKLHSNTTDTIRIVTFCMVFVFSPRTVISISFETFSVFPASVSKVIEPFFNLILSFLFHI